MKCPVCRAHEQYDELEFRTAGFCEGLMSCKICGTVWAINHGAIKVVDDPQDSSFLSALSECVEADDYSLAA
jgi:hypothetical protein